MGEDTRREELAARAVQLESEVLANWSAFTDAQPAYVKEFLMEQARLTSIEQAEVTREIVGGVPALREGVTNAIGLVVEDMKAHFGAVDNVVVVAGWRDQPDNGGTGALVRPFIEVMLSFGYRGGLQSRASGRLPAWNYYEESRYSDRLERRSSGLPMSPKRDEYFTSVHELRSVQTELSAHDDVMRRSAIANEWDVL